MSFLRKRSRSQCSLSMGDDGPLTVPSTTHEMDLKSRTSTTYSVRSSCSELDAADFAVQDSCILRSTPKHKPSHLRFLTWVAYTRKYTHEWISADERRTCPLLWCRAVCEDQEAMLQHVWTCEYLSKGLYWCFHCQKPERIGKTQCKRCQGLPSRGERMASVAKRIFSKIGKPHHRHEQASPSVGMDSSETMTDLPDPAPIPKSVVCSKERPPLRDDGPVNWVNERYPQELPYAPIVSEMPGDWAAAPSELHDTSIAEMVGTECPAELGDDSLRWPDNFYAENLEDLYEPPAPLSLVRGRSPKLALDTSVTSVTLSSDYLSQGRALESHWFNGAPSDTIISPLSPARGTSTFDFSTDISPTDSIASGRSIFTDSGYSSATSLTWSFSENELSRNCSVESRKDKGKHDLGRVSEDWTSQPLCARPVTVPEYPTIAEGLSRSSSGALHASERCPEADSTPLRVQCARSQDLVHSFAEVLDEHMQHTKRSLDAIAPSAIVRELQSMSRTSLVSIGLDTLVAMLEGRNPTAISQVFAFTHVACAAAIVVDGDGAKVHTNAWFEDSMKLVPERQRPLYLQIARCIWAPSDQSVAQPLEVCSSSPNGMVLAACRTFLHIFEHSQDREAQYSPPVDKRFDYAQSAFERNAKIKVIHELMRQPSIEAFVVDVMTVEERLLQGKIKSIRGVELELLCAGKVSSQSETAYASFEDCVSRLCDPLYALDNAPVQSRICYYIKDVSMIKRLMPEEVQDQASHEFEEGPHESSPAEADVELDNDDLLDHFDFDSFERGAYDTLRTNFDLHAGLLVTDSLPWASSEQHTEEPVQTTARFFICREPPLQHSPPPATTLPLSIPTLKTPHPPSRATTAGPPPLATPAYRCHCGYVPTGEERWKASNLRRHKRTQHPVEAKSYRCAFPGCTSQFSRSDNLRDHQRRKGHHETKAAGTPSGPGSKRRKVGEGNRES